MLQSRTRDAVIFQVGIAIFLLIVLLIILIPFWRVIVTAFIPLDIYTREGVPFFLSPTDWSFEAFRQLLTHSMFPRAAFNSVIITALGTAISLFLTIPLAYGLSTMSEAGLSPRPSRASAMSLLMGDSISLGRSSSILNCVSST